VTTTTKTTIFLDAQGNVTDTVTNVTKEYKTDEDSYNTATPAVDGEETSVPVYQYKHITNKQGTELPSTGGIGTTIFYVMGSILVICAGVVLVTRRRMSA
jgi:LPXTG-motif cell wall-anchored protein